MSMKIGAGAPSVSLPQLSELAQSTKGASQAGGSDPMAQLQQLLDMLQQLEGGQKAGATSGSHHGKSHGGHVGW